MSLGAKIALGASVTFTASIITYVHYKQVSDKQNMREGIRKDVQRQEMKKRQNIKELQDQIELTNILRKQMKDNESPTPVEPQTPEGR